MKIADADYFFTASGFFREMLPAIVGISICFAGVGYFSTSDDSGLNTKLQAASVFFVVTLVLNAIRYWFAGQKHKELKQLYAERYVSLVEDGKIPIDAYGILMLNAPWLQVRKLIFEESAYIPPRDP